MQWYNTIMTNRKYSIEKAIVQAYLSLRLLQEVYASQKIAITVPQNIHDVSNSLKKCIMFFE